MQKLNLDKKMVEEEPYHAQKVFIGEIKANLHVKILEILSLGILMGQRYLTRQKLQEDIKQDMILFKPRVVEQVQVSLEKLLGGMEQPVVEETLLEMVEVEEGQVTLMDP